jgi:hypothetical protein
LLDLDVDDQGSAVREIGWDAGERKRKDGRAPGQDRIELVDERTNSGLLVDHPDNHQRSVRTSPGQSSTPHSAAHPTAHSAAHSAAHPTAHSTADADAELPPRDPRRSPASIFGSKRIGSVQLPDEMIRGVQRRIDGELSGWWGLSQMSSERRTRTDEIHVFHVLLSYSVTPPTPGRIQPQIPPNRLPNPLNPRPHPSDTTNQTDPSIPHSSPNATHRPSQRRYRPTGTICRDEERHARDQGQARGGRVGEVGRMSDGGCGRVRRWGCRVGWWDGEWGLVGLSLLWRTCTHALRWV